MDNRSRLAINVYAQAEASQNRVLLQCLGPALRSRRARGDVYAYWWNRLDIRGPHVFGVVTVAESRRAAVRAELERALETHLRAHPSPEIDPAALLARHEECRGMILCAADALPGMAENNSFRILDHPWRGYPFNYSEGVAEEDALWTLATDLCDWTLRQLAADEGNPTAAAIGLIASLDLALDAAGLDAAACWRFHLGRVLPALRARLEAEGKTARQDVDRLLSPANRRTFDRLWTRCEHDGGPWPHAAELIRLACADPARPALLRELVHTTLKLLGVRVPLHIPLFIYAWQRHD